MTKYIIYKEGNEIKGSPAENYNSRIQNAHKITTFDGFTSLQQAKEYMIKYSDLTNDDIKILDELPND